MAHAPHHVILDGALRTPACVQPSCPCCSFVLTVYELGNVARSQHCTVQTLATWITASASVVDLHAPRTPPPPPRRVPGCAVQVDTGGNRMDMAGHPLETNPQKSGGNLGGKVGQSHGPFSSTDPTAASAANRLPVHCRCCCETVCLCTAAAAAAAAAMLHYEGNTKGHAWHGNGNNRLGARLEAFSASYAAALADRHLIASSAGPRSSAMPSPRALSPALHAWPPP